MDKKRILVVDDDVDLLNMLKLRLETEGYEFMCVQDGEEMFKVVRMRRPDVIILDVMLPKMDGYTTLIEMRKIETLKDIPVIILTAKEKQKVGDLFTLEKVAYFMEKPFETNDLLQKIRNVISCGTK